jgi:hypothetical protein
VPDDKTNVLCTWDEAAQCENCLNANILHCKWDRKVLIAFYAIGFPPLIFSILGMVMVGVLTGIWWTLISYAVILILFFGVFEIRILCSHCPYYAEESTVLHCLANHGMPKLWRYHPEPMNSFERMSLIVCFLIIFFLFPLAVQGYGIWILTVHYAQYGIVALLGLTGVALATLLTGVTIFAILRRFYCCRCVNFSCPLNIVPKEAVDEFLRKNPVMREAWERCGYRL